MTSKPIPKPQAKAQVVFTRGAHKRMYWITTLTPRVFEKLEQVIRDSELADIDDSGGRVSMEISPLYEVKDVMEYLHKQLNSISITSIIDV